MKDLLIQLIGQYVPVQYANGNYYDIPFICASVIVAIVIFCIVRGIFLLIKRG